MLSMIQAHGLEAGPTQRPMLAGLIAGQLSRGPAAALMWALGTLHAIRPGQSVLPVNLAAAFAGMMLLAGLVYGKLFQRAADDAGGGWLFGLAFGFLVWMIGPVPVLQWLPPQPTLAGLPLVGLLLGQLLWGLMLGLVFPLVHGRLHRSGVTTPDHES